MQLAILRCKKYVAMYFAANNVLLSLNRKFLELLLLYSRKVPSIVHVVHG